MFLPRERIHRAGGTASNCAAADWCRSCREARGGHRLGNDVAGCRSSRVQMKYDTLGKGTESCLKVILCFTGN